MTWVVKLAPGQTKIFVKELIVDKNVKPGTVIDSAAQITVDDITEDTNSVSINILNGYMDSDNLMNGNGFPMSAIGWLILLILLAGFIYLIKLILQSTKK
jgi:hypothetical protein